MPGPTTDSRIYLLDVDESRAVPGGPPVLGPDGVPRAIPTLVFDAVQHVLAAMRAGRAVKITPLRPELPIDEAADAIAIGPGRLAEVRCRRRRAVPDYGVRRLGQARRCHRVGEPTTAVAARGSIRADGRGSARQWAAVVTGPNRPVRLDRSARSSMPT
jgi:hypothetical protein